MILFHLICWYVEMYSARTADRNNCAHFVYWFLKVKEDTHQIKRESNTKITVKVLNAKKRNNIVVYLWVCVFVLVCLWLCVCAQYTYILLSSILLMIFFLSFHYYYKQYFPMTCLNTLCSELMCEICEYVLQCSVPPVMSSSYSDAIDWMEFYFMFHATCIHIQCGFFPLTQFILLSRYLMYCKNTCNHQYRTFVYINTDAIQANWKNTPHLKVTKFQIITASQKKIAMCVNIIIFIERRSMKYRKIAEYRSYT